MFPCAIFSLCHFTGYVHQTWTQVENLEKAKLHDHEKCADTVTGFIQLGQIKKNFVLKAVRKGQEIMFET